MSDRTKFARRSGRHCHYTAERDPLRRDKITTKQGGELMSALVADGAVLHTASAIPSHAVGNARLVARLERLPVTPRLLLLRVIVGIATFFDAYTVLAIAFAMPQLVAEWKLTPTEVGMIISAGYVGQLFGAVLFGSLAEKIGRLKTLFITILLFVSMDIACLFAWSGVTMMAFRFLQGVGTGGEVPVASAYINEFIGAEKRGRFFLLYEVIFPIGLMFAGMAGYFLVPIYGWKAMFVVGLIPAVVTIPWTVEFSTTSAGPSLSCAALVPVNAPFVAVPSDHSV